MVKFELWVHLVLVLQGGVDGIVLDAGCLADGCILGDLIGLRAAVACINQSNKLYNL